MPEEFLSEWPDTAVMLITLRFQAPIFRRWQWLNLLVMLPTSAPPLKHHFHLWVCFLLLSLSWYEQALLLNFLYLFSVFLQLGEKTLRCPCDSLLRWLFEGMRAARRPTDRHSGTQSQGKLFSRLHNPPLLFTNLNCTTIWRSTNQARCQAMRLTWSVSSEAIIKECKGCASLHFVWWGKLHPFTPKQPVYK